MKPSATGEVDLTLTLTVELDQFIASVQVKIIDFLLSCDGQSCILMRLLNQTNPN